MSMPSLFDRFRTKIVVYQYGVSAARADAEILNEDRWVPIDQCSVRSLLAQERTLVRRFLRLLGRGFAGVFLVRGGRWISYVWISEPGRAAPVHLQRWIKPRDSYWILEGHTREEFRGRGYFSRALEHVVKDIQSKSHAPLIYVDARAENIASRRAILSAGFSPSGVITTYQLWLPWLGSCVIRSSWRRQMNHPNLGVSPAPVLAEEGRPVQLQSIRPGPNRSTTQSASQKNVGLRNSGE